ncbi:MAG: transporter substrate-binding domain-containing protein [Undibacterium sp.]|nr:transporter substrate-binding domain-containing protein [Undibacterium sp.]
MSLLHSNLRHLVLAAFLLLATPICAASAGAIACGSKPIRLAFYEFGYFYFQTPSQQPQGIDKEIIDELIKRSGCVFQIQVMKRARIWEDLANGNLDMSVSGIRNPERDQFAWFATYLSMKNYAVLHKSIKSIVHDFESFLAATTLQFGAVSSFKHGELQDQFLSKLRKAGRLQDSPDAEALFRKLKENRVSGIFAQAPVSRKWLRELSMEADVAV